MNAKFFLATAITATLAFTSPIPALAGPNGEIRESAEVFAKMVSDSNSRIPAELIRESEAIAIISNIKEGGFIFGARRGDGIIVSRIPNGRWSNPAFINVSGGSFGLQAGFQSSDIVIIFPSQTALRQVLSGEFELGGSVSGTAGPIGRSASESLEGFDNNKVYVYSRSKGLFGGVTLEGTEISFDGKDSRKFYGKTVTSAEILRGATLNPPSVVGVLNQALLGAE